MRVPGYALGALPAALVAPPSPGLAAFRDRAARLRPWTGREAGDDALNPDFADGLRTAALRPAAVLIGVVDRPDGPTVILTKRTAHLRAHSGQVAFPGGRIDPGDASPESAALRETQEELGLDPGRIELVGRLPDYRSGSGYRIAPILGIVAPDARLTPNPAEVEYAFEAPLALLLDRAAHRRASRVFEGRERHYWVIPWRDADIWGVTAGIVRLMADCLMPEDA